MLKQIETYKLKQFVSLIERHLPEIHYFSNVFLQRRILFVMKKMGFQDWKEFIGQSEKDHQFIDKFLFYFTVPATELFRDTEVWKTLLEVILPKLLPSNPRVWIPDAASGEELFSLCILLSEMNALDQVTIYAGSKSKLAIEQILNGELSLQNEMVFLNNFKSIGTSGKLTDYYKRSSTTLNFNQDLLQRVQFLHAPSVLQQQPQDINLILFRNTLLYYTEDLKHRFISHLYNQLVYGGYLTLGLKEGQTLFGIDTLFKLEKPIERIYRKK